VVQNVYFSHDGAVDDLVSLFLLLQMDNVKLIGVGAIGADSYTEPAVSASRKIIDRFGHGEKLEVASSNARGVHTFPTEWRMDSFRVDAFPVLNEFGAPKTPIAKEPAWKDMVDKIMASDSKVTVLMTGPLTDLASALKAEPKLQDKIEKLVWMGGTFDNRGNVAEPEQDGTMEWNAFWDPEAVKTVWDSSLEIHMVGLESTRKVPLTNDVRDRWAKQRKYAGLDLIGNGYALVPPLAHFETNSTYYLWDVLTTVSSQYPEIVKTKIVNSDVISDGPAQGRTFEKADGRPVEMVYDVDHDAFFDKIDELARKAD